MKYTLSSPIPSWNGRHSLPAEIHTRHTMDSLSEFELLGAICGLHGFVCAMDILTGAEQGSEKDADLDAVLTAFQAYLSPRMPLSMYTGSDKRIRSQVSVTPPNAIQSSTGL